VRVAVSSSVLAAVLLEIYSLALDQSRDLATARTIIINLVVVCGVVQLSWSLLSCGSARVLLLRG